MSAPPATTAPTDTHLPSRLPGVIAMAAAITCFASSSSIVVWSHTPGSVIALWRMVLAVPIWLALASVNGHRPTLRSIQRAAPAGIFFGVNIALFFTAVSRTTIAHAEFITALSPFLLVPAGFVFFKERLNWWWLLLGVPALGGLLLVIFNTPDTGKRPSMAGDLMMIATLASWTGYMVLSKHIRRQMSVTQFMASATPIAALTLVPIAALRGGATDMSARSWVAVALLATLTGTIGHGLIQFAHSHVPVATISIMQVSQPALGVACAYVIVDQRVLAVQVVGMAIVILSVALYTVGTTRSTPSRPAAERSHDALP